MLQPESCRHRMHVHGMSLVHTKSACNNKYFVLCAIGWSRCKPTTPTFNPQTMGSVLSMNAWDEQKSRESRAACSMCRMDGSGAGILPIWKPCIIHGCDGDLTTSLFAPTFCRPHVLQAPLLSPPSWPPTTISHLWRNRNS